MYTPSPSVLPAIKNFRMPWLASSRTVGEGWAGMVLRDATVSVTGIAVAVGATGDGTGTGVAKGAMTCVSATGGEGVLPSTFSGVCSDDCGLQATRKMTALAKVTSADKPPDRLKLTTATLGTPVG